MRQDYPNFVRLEETIVDRIITKVRTSFKPDANLTPDDFKTVVEGLLLSTEPENALLYVMQDKLCKRCGDCCRKICTVISFSKEEFRKIAKYLKTDYKTLKKKTHAIPCGDGSVRISGKPCIFLKGKNVCTIYEVRPLVCRAYPAGSVIINNILPSDCPIGEELLVRKAQARLFLLALYKSGDKEMINELETLQSNLWKGFEHLSPVERTNEAIKRLTQMRRQIEVS